MEIIRHHNSRCDRYRSNMTRRSRRWRLKAFREIQLRQAFDKVIRWLVGTLCVISGTGEICPIVSLNFSVYRMTRMYRISFQIRHQVVTDFRHGQRPIATIHLGIARVGMRPRGLIFRRPDSPADRFELFDNFFGWLVGRAAPVIFRIVVAVVVVKLVTRISSVFQITVLVFSWSRRRVSRWPRPSIPLTTRSVISTFKRNKRQ